MQSINLADKLATFSYWQPRVVGEFDGHDLMVVKVKDDGIPQWQSLSVRQPTCHFVMEKS